MDLLRKLNISQRLSTWLLCVLNCRRLLIMSCSICEEGDWHSILAKKYLVWFSGDRTTAPSLLVRALYRRDHRAVQKFS